MNIMTDIDYSSTYDFTLDPFVENNKLDNGNLDNGNLDNGNLDNGNLDNNNGNTDNNNNQDNNNFEKNPGGVGSGQGCKLFFIVIVYLIVKELGLAETLLNNGIKKMLFIGLLWLFGYDLINKVIGFEKNVCSYLF